MDRSGPGDGPVTVESIGGEIRQPEKRSVGRRLVQSTLFPQKSPDAESNGVKEGNNGGEDHEDGQDEECCGSQGKKKRARKGKSSTTQQNKASKKSKEKSPVKSTPKKNAKSDAKTVAQFTENEDASPPVIPNLRLEAKLMAEENSRLFAGKQIHPFFSSRKTIKRCQETTEVESDCCLVQQKNKDITVGPIHVFERDQDDALSFDWRNWNFYEKSFTSSSCSLEVSSSSASERVPPMPFDAQEACCQQMTDEETECEIVRADLFTDCVKKADATQQSELQERIMSCYLGCGNQLEERLWTDKYQPKKAMEVCGNNELVKFLSDWLCSWRQRSHQANKDSSCVDEDDMEDSDDDICFGSDSDSENRNQEASHKNVLLVTGPVGSGKSAAIYACAKEQGFKILEVNASECRNGAVVKQKFGEALESHSLEWSQENHAESQTMHVLKPPNGEITLDSEVVEVIRISDEDNSHRAIETSGKFINKDSSISCGRVQVKPLILFEDVDITFPEDRGLIAAIQQIAEKAKGPVILTSNCDNPELPDNLDRIELCFTMPSDKELHHNVHMVCSAEKVSIQPHLVNQLINYCRGDIRKIIMHLQFWCQGKRSRKGRELQRLPGLFLFDTEAGYQILPRMIPWDFPSGLSELVEKEITIALSKMGENCSFMEVNEKEFDDTEMQNNLEMHACVEDNVDAKKEAMLRTFFDLDCNDFTGPLDAARDLLNSSGTPVSVFCRNRRRKLNVVMSSDSEDEILNEGLPVASRMHTKIGLCLEDNGTSPSNSLGKQNCSAPSNDVQLCAEPGNQDEIHYQFSEVVTDLNVEDACKSVDVSCVLESSYVPETEVKNKKDVSFDRISCGQMNDTLDEVSVSNEFKQNLPVEEDSLDKSVPKLHKHSDFLRRPCDIIATSSHEEVEDSLNVHVEADTREYQLMDECSRVDFNNKLKPLEKLNSYMVQNLVQESWRKLHSRQTELRQFIASENKDAYDIIKLVHGISNLISEADILCLKCRPLDSWELPMILSEEFDAFNWYNEHLEMTSTIAWDGFQFYAQAIAAAGLKMGSEIGVDLTWEMLSTTTMNEVHRLSREDASESKTSDTDLDANVCLPESSTMPNSESKSCIFDIIQSIVPSRSYMTLKGDAFFDYLFSLRHISRSEASRLSEGTGKRKGRRGRAARNYLNSGTLSLSPEDISLLGQSNFVGKSSSKSTANDTK